jgi:hypothetical protein
MVNQMALDVRRRSAVRFRRFVRLAVTLIASFIVLTEEIRYGYILGKVGFLCELTGGSPAPAQGRCVTRACSWFGDCGFKVHPTNYLEHISPGDSSGKVVFWLGEPGWIRGDTYYWAVGKFSGANRFFSTTFQNGKFVKWDFEVDPPRALKPAEHLSDVAPAKAPQDDQQ